MENKFIELNNLLRWTTDNSNIEILRSVYDEVFSCSIDVIFEGTVADFFKEYKDNNYLVAGIYHRSDCISIYVKLEGEY